MIKLEMKKMQHDISRKAANISALRWLGVATRRFVHVNKYTLDLLQIYVWSLPSGHI